MIKAAFFDIDGTLLSFKTHQVSEGTIRACDRLHKMGIKTFLSTGRAPALIPDMPLHFDGRVTTNGSLVFVDNKVLVRNFIPQEEVKAWLEYAKRNQVSTMLFGETEMWGAQRDAIFDKIHDQLQFKLPPWTDIDNLCDFETVQIIADIKIEQEPELAKLLPHCKFPRWHPDFTDVLAAGNSKATGIERILNHFGWNREESICFGDGGNDIEMLEYCGIGVAMGNAADNVKAHADYVTTSVDEEGIEQAVNNLIEQ